MIPAGPASATSPLAQSKSFGRLRYAAHRLVLKLDPDYGLIDASDARALVAAAAKHPRTRWCITALNPDGTAAAHGCASGRHLHPGRAATWTITSPGDQGGITCECDLAPLCRHHHRCKQAEGWRLEQPEPGLLIWHTPAGRTYVTTPTVYPV